MPKSSRPSTTPLDGDDFLAENRRNRELAKEEAARKAEKSAPDPSVPTAEESTPDGAAPKAAGRVASRRRSWLIPVLLALVVILAGTTGWLAYEYVDNRNAPAVATDAQRTEAMDTARKYAAQLATYDPANYADLDRRIREISTPDFAKSYIAASGDARRGNTAAKGTSKAVSNDAGITSFTDSKAVVLVTLDQTVTSPEVAADVPEGIPYSSRVRVTLERQDGRWLLAGLDTV